MNVFGFPMHIKVMFKLYVCILHHVYMSINYYKNNVYTLILKYSIQKMLSSDNAGLPQSFHLLKKKITVSVKGNKVQ